jgi:steroid delta-isomerase-like uncharacterized protein
MSQSAVDIAKAQITAYNQKDWNAVAAALASGCVYDEVATHRRVQGIKDIETAWKGWATALPDSNASFDNVSVSGNTVTLEITWRGTHNGPLQTPTGALPPSGRKMDIRACQVVEVADGKVQAIRHYFDMATLLQQLGAFSAT